MMSYCGESPTETAVPSTCTLKYPMFGRLRDRSAASSAAEDNCFSREPGRSWCASVMRWHLLRLMRRLVDCKNHVANRSFYALFESGWRDAGLTEQSARQLEQAGQAKEALQQRSPRQSCHIVYMSITSSVASVYCHRKPDRLCSRTPRGSPHMPFVEPNTVVTC